MLMHLLGADNKFVGILEDNFSFTAKETCSPSKVAFYKGLKHLFTTEFANTVTLNATDTLNVKLDSGIDFYYLTTQIRGPFTGAERTLVLWRSLRRIVQRIKNNEHKAREQLSTWDKQIYEVLFDEKQQPFSRRDSRLLVLRDLKSPLDRVQIPAHRLPKTTSNSKPISPAITLDSTKIRRR